MKKNSLLCESFKGNQQGTIADCGYGARQARLSPQAGWRLRCVRLFAILLGVGVISAIVSNPASAQRSGGGGGDIVVFDIVDAVVPSAARPTGGGGGDILVFDIVDAAVRSSARPAGGGGGDILVFDIVDAVVPTAGSDIADLAAKYTIYVLAATEVAGVYEVVLDTGEKMVFGLLAFDVTSSESEAYTFWLWLESGSGLPDFEEAKLPTIASSGYIKVKKLNSGD